MEMWGAGLKLPAVEMGLATLLMTTFLPLSVASPWIASRLLVLMLSLALLPPPVGSFNSVCDTENSYNFILDLIPNHRNQNGVIGMEL